MPAGRVGARMGPIHVSPELQAGRRCVSVRKAQSVNAGHSLGTMRNENAGGYAKRNKERET